MLIPAESAVRKTALSVLLSHFLLSQNYQVDDNETKKKKSSKYKSQPLSLFGADYSVYFMFLSLVSLLGQAMQSSLLGHGHVYF